MKRSLILIALVGFGTASAFALAPIWISPAVLASAAKVATADTAAVTVEKCVCGDRSPNGANCICRGTGRCTEKCGGDCGKCPARGDCGKGCCDGPCKGSCGDKCTGPCKDKCQGPCGDKCQGPCKGKCGGPCGGKSPGRAGCKRAA